MKVLILGGTGTMGTHLVKKLVLNYDDDISVYVTSRKEHESTKNVNYLLGNAHDAQFLKKITVNNWDVIVDFMAYSTGEFNNIMPILLNRTSQYIFISSARIYAESNNKLITESTDRLLDVSLDKQFLDSNEYSLEKAKQEDMLKYSGKRNWTIVRPYITYGENKFQLGPFEKDFWLYRALHNKKIIFSADIANKITTLTDGADVAAAIAALIGNPKAMGEDYNITSDYSLSWNEILDIYLDILEKCIGKRPEVFMLDSVEYFKYGVQKYQIKYDRLYNRKFDNSKIKQIINTDSFKTPEVGLSEYLKKFCESSPKMNIIDAGTEAYYDRLAKDKTYLAEFKTIKHKIKYILYQYLKK